MSNGLHFPHSDRLTTTAEFHRVRSEGKSHRGALLTLGVLAGQSTGPRAGFITSKRVGNAVARNRTRRRLREIFRKHRAELAGGVWIVSIASVRTSQASFAALEDDWLRLARRASILAP